MTLVGFIRTRECEPQVLSVSAQKKGAGLFSCNCRIHSNAQYHKALSCGALRCGEESGATDL